MTTEILHIEKLRSSNDMSGIMLNASEVESFAQDSLGMRKKGIGISNSLAQNCVSMDAGLVQPVTAGMGTPVQFLREFLPGVVYILTQARRGDLIAPVATVGNWRDEEIAQPTLEFIGSPEMYKDHGDVPITSWVNTYEIRSIVRFEIALESNKLAIERASAAQINDRAEKRKAVAMALEILRNEIFFNGFNAGVNRTYGVLNDPNLPAFVTVDVGGSGTTPWPDKTVAEIITDLVTNISRLRKQSGSHVDPESMPIKLALASDVKDQLNKTDASFTNGMTVNKWIKDNYPNITVESIPEFNEAFGGENVAYMYAPVVSGTGSDGDQTMMQLVPAKMQSLNTTVTTKGIKEGYTNALAGCLVKRGWAVVRLSGI